jgi:hypothetical protein
VTPSPSILISEPDRIEWLAFPCVAFSQGVRTAHTIEYSGPKIKKEGTLKYTNEIRKETKNKEYEGRWKERQK